MLSGIQGGKRELRGIVSWRGLGDRGGWKNWVPLGTPERSCSQLEDWSRRGRKIYGCVKILLKYVKHGVILDISIR
ncbi:hypothetical protein CEXT_123241 [Caerostris extrusa]|uniref:Uncharacterized protein n=1 Tax=Caerostris extrusa TaxID=172846 RepID=A0AAV4XYA5_CAEEX|nr:hypothetical protein CEXT_123241 [Caerostris extrusa]